MRDKEFIDLGSAYLKIYEQRENIPKIGIPLSEPTDRAAKKELEKLIPPGEKVHTFKGSLQKAHYEVEGEELNELQLPGTGMVIAPQTRKDLGVTFPTMQRKFLGMNVGKPTIMSTSSVSSKYGPIRQYTPDQVSRYNRLSKNVKLVPNRNSAARYDSRTSNSQQTARSAIPQTKKPPKSSSIETAISGLKASRNRMQLQLNSYDTENSLFYEDSEDFYDIVLDCLLSEGYSEKESNKIMVSLVNENFWKSVQQRTGIGKPGVGPGQVAKNILRAGISDVLGASIATGSTPSSVSAARTPSSIAPSSTPVVKSSTKAPRTAPKGANVLPDPWEGGSTRTQNTSKPKPRTSTTTRSLPGSSGPNIRGMLPSSSSSRGTGAIIPAPRSNTGKPSSTRIQPVTVRELPTSRTQSLPGSSGPNIRGLLSPGVKDFQRVKNILPDPWKQVSDTVSGTRPLWNRVQQIIKPQAQLKPAQTNVRAMLPAAKPSPSNASTKPTSTARSSQFRDIQRLNRMTGGGLIGELPSTKPTSKPAPKTTGVDKLAPKPAEAAKPAIKPQMPGGSKNLQGLGILGSLRNLTPLGVAAAVMAPRPTADGTLTTAMQRGDVAPPPPVLPPPRKQTQRTKPKNKTSIRPTLPTTPKSTTRIVTPKPIPKEVDSDLQKYDELRKTDPVKAKELGTRIWLKKYGAPTSEYA